MKKVFFCLVILPLIIGCSGYKEAYISTAPRIDKPKKDTLEQIEINPKNFFYLRLEEYFETFEYEQNTDGVSRNNEASACLYRSINRDSTEYDSKIVEEKYMYLENYDTDSSGRVLYFKTARYVNDGKLKRYYSDSSKIHINTAKKVSLGYWYLQASDTTYHLLMTNGSKKYQVVAKGDGAKISFVQISHPNVDENSRETESDQLIKVKSVMNVGDDDGLIFYRNMPSTTNPERAIVYNGSHKIESFVFVYRDDEIKNVISEGRSFIKMEDGGVAKERWKYMESIVIPTLDRELFEENKKVARRFDKKEELKKPKG